MALIQPDFTEVADSIEVGETVMARIVKAEAGTFESGTPYINWTMETFGSEDAKNDGRKLWVKTPTSGKGAFKLKDLYKTVVGEQLEGQFDTDQLVNGELKVAVSERNGWPDYKFMRPE